MATGLTTLDDFVGLKSDTIDDCCFLVLSFYAGRGLPGTERSDLDAWLAKRDQMAALTQLEIRRNFRRFDPKSREEPTPYSYGNSLGRFLCWIGLHVMSMTCGVNYHPDRKDNPDSAEPVDIFAHGVMDDEGQGGTCASLPVVFVSVLRRLGFPVYLVETPCHRFMRWDDPVGTTFRSLNPDLEFWIPPDRFNFDGSGDGISYHPDQHYREWPVRWNENDFKHGKNLLSTMDPENWTSG